MDYLFLVTLVDIMSMVRRVKIDILVDIMSIYNIMSIYIIGYHAYFYVSVTPLSFHYTVFYYFFVKFVQ